MVKTMVIRPNAVSGASLSTGVVLRFPHFSVDASSCSQLQFETKRPLIANDQIRKKTYCVSLNYTKYVVSSLDMSEHRKVKIVCDFIAASVRAFVLFAYLLLCTMYVVLMFLLWFTLCNYVHVQVPHERTVLTLGASGVARYWYKKQSILI